MAISPRPMADWVKSDASPFDSDERPSPSSTAPRTSDVTAKLVVSTSQGRLVPYVLALGILHTPFDATPLPAKPISFTASGATDRNPIADAASFREATVLPSPNASTVISASSEREELRSRTRVAWQGVLAALRDARWDLRTAEGIAGETGLSVDEVNECLATHASEVRRSLLLDREGRALYTSRDRRRGWRETLVAAQAYISKSTSRLS